MHSNLSHGQRGHSSPLSTLFSSYGKCLRCTHVQTDYLGYDGRRGIYDQQAKSRGWVPNSNSNYSNTNPNDAEKPMLRAEVYSRALRASQNRKEAGSIILPPPSKVESVHEIILKPDLSRFCVCFCIEESAPLFSLTPRQEAPLLLWCYSSVAPRWPQLRFSNAERCFRNEL